MPGRPWIVAELMDEPRSGERFSTAPRLILHLLIKRWLSAVANTLSPLTRLLLRGILKEAARAG